MTIESSRLSACILMARSWDLQACIDGWQRSGPAAPGLPFRRLESFGLVPGVRALTSSTLAVANLQMRDGFELVAPDSFDAKLPRTLRGLDAAAELGADCVYAFFGSRGSVDWSTASDRFVDQVGQLLPSIGERGLRLALEPIHSLRQDLSFVNAATDAAALVDWISDPGVGYVFDMWHLWWQRDAVDEAGQTASSVFSVQPSDHKAVAMRTPRPGSSRSGCHRARRPGRRARSRRLSGLLRPRGPEERQRRARL